MAGDLHGHGTTLKVGTGTSATTIGYITSIGGPDQARDSVDVSTMDNTHRAFIPGLLDSGEATIELNYDGSSGGSANKLNILRTATAATWTITLNDGGTATDSSWACAGFITGVGHAIPYDDKVTQSVSLKFTGAPTYTDLA